MTDVLVRADASLSSGSGHVVRQLTLAEHLVARGATVTFACRETPGHRLDQIVAAGHTVIRLPDLAEERAAVRPWDEDAQLEDARTVLYDRAAWDVVIVDHYHLDHSWETLIRPVTGRLVAVDDLNDRRRDVDLLVDQNWYGPDTATRYDEMAPGAATLLGPAYALLQRAYARERGRRTPVAVPPRRVLVAFGGADVTGETAKVVAAMRDPALGSLEVDVVVGAAAAVTERLESLVADRPRTTLHVAVPSVAPLLATADLAIGASGAATWERMCLRVPAIVATTRPEQSGVTSQLADAGLTTWVGLTAETTEASWREVLTSALVAPPPKPPDLVDGRGAARVAMAILPPAEPPIDVLPATINDAPMFMGADRHDAAGPRVLDGPDAWRREGASFASQLTADDPPLVIQVDGVPVGSVLQGREGAPTRLQDVFALQPGLAPRVAPIVDAAVRAWSGRQAPS